MKRRLHLMVGLPRSGKTTRALELGYPIVCPDAIRLAIHGQAFIPEAEPVVWAHAKIMARALFLAGHNDVTIDATNTTFKRREFWIEEGFEIVYHIINTGAAECIQRALFDNRPELCAVIKRMDEQFEEVTE